MKIGFKASKLGLRNDCKGIGQDCQQEEEERERGREREKEGGKDTCR